MAQGGAVGVGRSTAIVLFTDVVGSTELRSRLGEDAGEELRHKHDALVAAAVEVGRGNLVKNLGDGIMATFTGAADAVGAAVAIQQAIGRHNRSASTALEVRIGISAGDVGFETDDCFGTPVIEAARLCGAAGGGQILASEMVRWLARSCGGTFTPVGNLELKGLPEAVPTVQVDWELLPESSLPLPPLLTDIGRIFVGRVDDLERLGQLWKEATAGELRVALLAGEPGVGKTRLAAELARRVHDEGAAVVAGRCDEDLGVPYQPFVEALRHFVDHVQPSELQPCLGRYGGELVRLVPELVDRQPDLPPPLSSDPETERYRLFDAVTSWLAAAAAHQPVLLVLDDLQWAAKPTLLLLRHVVCSAETGGLLIVGTYRDTELTHDHPLAEVLADLRRRAGVERLSLSGLDSSGVARRLALHRRVAEAIETIHGAALDDHLPALAHHWGRASAAAAMTPKAVDYATRAGHRALAQLAHDEAVGYYRQALEFLRAAEGPVDEHGRLELLVCLGEAEHRVGDPAHRETLLRAAELARRHGDAAALARAALAGTRGILPTSVGWVDREKVAVLEAAVAAVGDRDLATRARLLATLGVELTFAADSRRCLAMSDEAVVLARSLGDPEMLARVLMARNFPTCAPGLLDERLANTAELLDVVKAVGDPALVAEAHLFRGRTAFEAGEVAEADRCLAVADRLSAGVGQPALRWRVTYIQAARAVIAGRFPDAERLIVESRDLGHLIGQPDAILHFARQLVCLRLAQRQLDTETLSQIEAVGTVPLDDSAVARVAWELGRREQAAAALERFAAAAVPLDMFWLPGKLNWAAVAAGLGLAHHAEVLERALRPYAALPVAMLAIPTASVAHHLGLLSATLGRLEQAEEDFLAGCAIHERIGAPHWLAASRLELARVLLAQGRAKDDLRARDFLRQALGTARELGLTDIEQGAVELLSSQ